MARDLPSSYTVGKTRFTHAGYAVYKLYDLNSPSDRISGPVDSEIKAIESAENLGEGYAAFRMVRSPAGVTAKEMLRREDLPINLV